MIRPSMTRENIRRTIHSQKSQKPPPTVPNGGHPPADFALDRSRVPHPLPPLTPPRSFSMEDVVALERLATLHGAFVDDAARAVGVESFCQLCLKTLDDASGTAAPGRTCPSGHVCCLSCASVLNPDDARAPWSSRAGCPACHADDTDDGMTRLFARPESRGERFDDKPRRHPLAPLLIRDALTADDSDALAGVLVAERRAAFKALDDEPPTPSASSDAAWPPWDCGAQLRSAFASLPTAADAERAFPGGVLDLALVSNGSALLGGSLGIRIDAHATVVRFNEYECGGVYASDVGCRVDAHATGWLMAASRDDPRVDRLCAEDPPDDDAEHETPESAPESAPGSAPESAPTAEVRLMPNVERLGRAYYASYLCAVATHRRTRWRDAEDWWRRRRGPVAFVVAPKTYGRHWRHVRDTGADTGADRVPTLAADDDGEVFPARMTARVTSGYAFALLALDLTGQPLPGEWFAEKERDEEELISRSSRSASTSSSSSSPTGRVTLYGFEDDARNARDFAGGHFFDGLHRQAHHLYDFPWERGAMATMARARGPDRFRRVTVLADE